jgi:hypothetical protein
VAASRQSRIVSRIALAALSLLAGREAHKELSPPILSPPGPKGVAEEVEFDILMLAFPVIVLAIHNLGLLRVKLKTAFLQTSPDRFEHELRLSPALGVNDQLNSLGEFHPQALTPTA